jgi:ADP-ribose pyrophosphatase
MANRNREGGQLRWATENRETAYECPGFSIVHEDIRLPDGTETDFDYLADDPSVVVLPFTPDGEVITIEEWRQAVKRVTWSVPAGGVETDEDLAAAARRELEEETGYEPESVRHLATFEPATGISNATFHYFVATGCRQTGERSLDADESIRVAPSSLEALFEAVDRGDLEDGRTALGLLAYAHERTDLSDVEPPAE